MHDAIPQFMNLLFLLHGGHQTPVLFSLKNVIFTISFVYLFWFGWARVNFLYSCWYGAM